MGRRGDILDEGCLKSVNGLKSRRKIDDLGPRLPL
jgi:hypothetical protein